MKNELLKVGQTVFITKRYDRNRNEIEEAIITKIGRIYFEVGRFGKFKIDTLEHQNVGYSSAYDIYLTEELYKLKVERDLLNTKIRNFFNGGLMNKLTIEELRKINEITDKNML